MTLSVYGPFTPNNMQLASQWQAGNPIQYTPAPLITVSVEVTDASQVTPNAPHTFQYRTSVVGFDQHLVLPNGALLGVNNNKFYSVQPL